MMSGGPDPTEELFDGEHEEEWIEEVFEETTTRPMPTMRTNAITTIVPELSSRKR